MRHRTIHDLTSYDLPNVFGFRADTAGPDQDEIVRRLIAYYRYMKGEADRGVVPGIKGMWAQVSKTFADFEAVLASGDVRAVSEALLKVCTTPLVSGFASYHYFDSILRDPRARMFESYLTIDRLLCLGEALGAAAPQTPFQPRFGYHNLDLRQLILGIRDRLPFDMATPRAGGGAFGVKTAFGVLSGSDILAMYVAQRAHALLAGAGDRTVCEIGGGTGTLACYLAKTCATRVTVADLPIVSIIQGYYTMKSVGPDAVHLAGEPDRDARVRIIPYWQLDDLPEDSVSLFVNVDSMPEIDRDIAQHYMGLIRRAGSGAFLSINQESEAGGQNRVQTLAEQAGGFRRDQRFPYWMIAGYVEELYAITG